jgi:hypothetical protein
MGLVLTTTAGLMLWVVLWSLNVSGLDAILIPAAMIVVGAGVRTVLPHLPGRRD